MTKKRQSTQSGIKDDVEFFNQVNEFAVLDAQLREAEAQRDQSIQAVRDSYESRIDTLKKRKAAILKSTAVFAALNKDTVLDKERRSGETTQARYGFQLNPQKLVVLSRQYKMDDILTQALLQPEEWRAKYLRYSKVELNKHALMTDMTDSDLAKLGLKKTQSDSFYISPIN